MSVVVGMDVGGSGVRGALVESDGSTGAVARVPLEARGVGDVVEAVRRVAEPLAPERIGLAIPGFIRGGVVLGSPNFEGWEGVDIGGAIREALGVPVTVVNDANACALGLWRSRGATEDLVLLTLGTGVGGGVVTGGRLLVGAGGTGAELGHLYAGGDRPCGCGGVGCLETWVSTSGLLNAAAELGFHLEDGEAVVAAARAGEAWARHLVDEAAAALGRGLTTLVNVFNPDVIALAGGLSGARDLLEPRALAWLRAHGVPPSVEQVRVEWVGRADRFAIAGAAQAARSS